MPLKIRFACVFSLFGLTASCYAQDSATIEWRLEQPFPLIAMGDYERIKNIAEGESGSTSGAAKSVKQLYERLADKWEVGQPFLANPHTTQYNSGSGRHVPGYVPQQEKTVTALFSLSGVQPDASCTWQSTAEPAKLAVKPCNAKAALSITYDKPTRVTVATNTGITQSVEAQAKLRVIVAIGDSYASGEGNPDIPALYHASENFKRPGSDWLFEKNMQKRIGAPAVWWDRQCHRSLVSWPVMSTLWRALTDSLGQTAYILLDYACSGAEIDNGVFFGQIDPPGGARKMAPRDGSEIVRTFDGEAVAVAAVERSQINAFFDDVCGAGPRLREKLLLPGSGSHAWIERCASPVRNADELHLSIGGNDIGFAPLARGFLIADEAKRGFLHKPFLWFFRKVAKTLKPEDVDSRIAALTQTYRDDVQFIATTIGVPPAKTTVVTYPDPIGDNSKGCVEADRGRIRDSNLVLGRVLPKIALGFGKGWTVEMTQSEVKKFQETYKKIEGMQKQLGVAENEAQRFRLVPFGVADDFEGLRMCDVQPQAGGPLPPYYFCSQFKQTTTDSCVPPKDIGQYCECDYWPPLSVSEWKPYTSQPRRRMVNSLNESILSARPWKSDDWSRDQIMESLTGSMHPTGAAHAAAADMVVSNPEARQMVQAEMVQADK